MVISSTIQVGVSACLAGMQVRYDGADKRSDICLNIIAAHFDLVTFCPEVAAGFGIPRAPMHLVGNTEFPALQYRDDGHEDLSNQLNKAIEAKLPGFSNLDGFILVQNSPSCGLLHVKVYQEDQQAYLYQGLGLFAAALRERFPMMPLVEERQLHELKVREQFIARVHDHRDSRTQEIT